MTYWNHNTAYYSWIEKQIEDRRRILDVGCGDGSLVYRLADGKRDIFGLEPCETVLLSAKEQYGSTPGTHWICETFEALQAEEKSFDAVVFSASLHHMDMIPTLRKAVSLLDTNGILLVVGLASPSSLCDWLTEGLRCIPSLMISAFHHMKSTEENGVPVSYTFPSMDEVRRIAAIELHDCKIRLGLHYRYLLRYIK